MSKEIKQTKQERELKLEDKVTHILSEWLNDNAPIGESAYRAPAKAVLKVAKEFYELEKALK